VNAGTELQPCDVRLETERLILRGYRAEDFPAYFEMSADPETFRFSDRGPMTSDEAWSRLLRHVGHWALLGYGFFAIEEKGSGRFVGEGGFCDFRRQIGPQFDGVPEGGVAISGWAKGLGYATEATRAAQAWMDDRGTRRTVLMTHAGNAASRRVAEKLGYKPFEERTYKGYPALLHERFAPER
jgi:RimJ/RimL family protein N-acetyltransferase